MFFRLLSIFLALGFIVLPIDLDGQAQDTGSRIKDPNVTNSNSSRKAVSYTHLTLPTTLTV